jgi:hypothetical protein
MLLRQNYRSSNVSSVQKKWCKLRRIKLLAETIRGIQFKDKERIDPLSEGELDRDSV